MYICSYLGNNLSRAAICSIGGLNSGYKHMNNDETGFRRDLELYLVFVKAQISGTRTRCKNIISYTLALLYTDNFMVDSIEYVILLLLFTSPKILASRLLFNGNCEKKTGIKFE